jgi:hypothetical protein
MQQKPQNLFCTKYVLSLIASFYIITLSPLIDKVINDNLTKKDIGNLINATLVTMFAAGLKGFDSNVYTPKGLPGRNKNDILNAINDPIINTIQAVQSTETAIQKPSINTISTALQDINDVTNSVPTSNNSIKDVSTIANTVFNPVSNVVGLVNDPINHVQSNLLDPFNNLLGINKQQQPNIKPLQFPESSAKTRLELISRQDTFYKLEPTDSTLLDISKKVEVREGTQLFIDDYYIDKESNHIIFNIGERIFYAFLDHIQLLDNGVQLLF